MQRSLGSFAIALSCAAMGFMAESRGLAIEGQSKPDRGWAARVDRLVAERQPTPAEKRFDEIGWLRSLREAERLSRSSGRPVFLFTHDGRMAIGRC
jgi:hypothetical protein